MKLFTVKYHIGLVPNEARVRAPDAETAIALARLPDSAEVTSVRTLRAERVS